MGNLEKRKEEILKDLVAEYIKTGKPVGSSSIVKKYKLNVSPATVRNEMAELEELGYIYQPHTSAGRVPTSKGYRFFVENMLKNKKRVNITDIELPDPKKVKDLRDLLSEVSDMISFHTKEISLVLAPDLEEDKIKYIHFFTVDKLVYIVLVTTTHTLEPIPVLKTSIPENELKRLENFINKKLEGLTLRKATRTLKSENFYVEEVPKFNEILKSLYITLHNEIRKGETREIYIKGIANLLSTRISIAEKKARFLLEMLEEKKLLEEIVEDVPSEDNIGFLIGEENKLPELWNYSLITVKYTIKELEGTLALLGPTRMDYVKGIFVLEKIADKLEELADKILT
ncbi:MAG: heat-inducible transcription repressor HrcA [Caldisericaceae bacterium]|nr:heat-inducible transcription repressor HrcA [Caldisericaceae bacterium]